jgi:hypothetical protein
VHTDEVAAAWEPAVSRECGNLRGVGEEHAAAAQAGENGARQQKGCCPRSAPMTVDEVEEREATGEVSL